MLCETGYCGGSEKYEIGVILFRDTLKTETQFIWSDYEIIYSLY